MILLRTQLSALARRPSRVILTGLALIVVSFMVFGTILARHSAQRAVVETFAGTPTGVDLVIAEQYTSGLPYDQQAHLTAETLQKIRTVPGIAEVSGKNSSFIPIWTDGDIGIVADSGPGPLSKLTILKGTYPDTYKEIAVSRLTLERMRLTMGGTITVQSVPPQSQNPAAGEDPQPVLLSLTIVGVVDTPDDTAKMAFTTDVFAMSLTGNKSLNLIYLRLAPGTSPDTAQANLARVLKPTSGAAPIITTGNYIRQEELKGKKQEIDMLFTILFIFIAISIAAATLVATSTFRILFAQRLRQLALLRAIGAGQGALRWALAAEGFLTGAIAGTVGVAAAGTCGQILPPILRSFDITVYSPGLPLAPAISIILGTAIIALIAVTAPAFSASRVAPLEALRTATIATSRTGIGVFRLIVGILLAVGAVLLFFQAVSSISQPQTSALCIIASGTLAFFTLVALGPILLRPILSVMGWPLRYLGPIGRLATGGVGAAPRRAAAVSVVVALGVTLIGGVLICGNTLKAMVNRDLAIQAPGDFLVISGDQTLSARFRDQVHKNANLRNIVSFRMESANVDGLKYKNSVSDLNLRNLSTWSDLSAYSGSLKDLGPGRVLISQNISDQSNVKLGKTLTIRRDGQVISLTVAAIIKGSIGRSEIIVSPTDLDRLKVPSAHTDLLANAAKPGMKARAEALNALQSLDHSSEMTIITLAQERDRKQKNLNIMIIIPLGLAALTVLVAIVGVATTTALSVIERIREAGTLRAIGMSRGGLRTMLTIEAGLYGIIGSVMGLLLAIPYALVLMATVDSGTSVTFPVAQLVLMIAVMGLLTAIAGLLPAGKAARVSPVSALATDG